MKAGLFFLSLVLVAFGQPAWLGYLGPLAASFGFALFWFTLPEKPSQRFWGGVIWFALVQSIQLSWITGTEYMGPLIWVVYIFLLLFMGIQFGFLSLFIKREMTSLEIAALAGLWVILEWSRRFLLTGFTWNPIGLSLTTTLFSLQSASLFGIYGLSFWVIFVNLLALQIKRRRWAIWTFCAIAPYLYGMLRLLSAYWEDTKTLSVMTVSTGLLPEERDYDAQRPDRYIPALQQWDRTLGFLDFAHQKKVDLIIFPEGAIPNDAYFFAYSYPQANKMWFAHFGAPLPTSMLLSGSRWERPISHLLQRDDGSIWKITNAFWMQSLANHFNCSVIAGLDDFDWAKNKHYNAAFCFSPDNVTAERTEKQILVPIGEYVPFRWWKPFSRWVAKEFGIESSFDAGKETTIFSKPIPIAVSICVEETYSEIVHAMAQKGAKLLVNISNDVWFPRSKLADQHFDHGLIRAVENGLPLVRVCNAGASGIVDCMGRTLEKQESNQSGPHLTQVPLNQIKTLYSLWGNKAILSLSLCLLFLKGLKRIALARNEET